MSRTVRRFEVLLPLRFNDGRPVPEDLVGATLIELENRFGATSCETQTIQGRWHSEGQLYIDDLFRVFIDVADVPESRQFFVDFKEQLKRRFDQIDIWMTTYLVEVI